MAAAEHVLSILNSSSFMESCSYLYVSCQSLKSLPRQFAILLHSTFSGILLCQRRLSSQEVTWQFERLRSKQRVGSHRQRTIYSPNPNSILACKPFRILTLVFGDPNMLETLRPRGALPAAGGPYAGGPLVAHLVLPSWSLLSHFGSGKAV